LTQYRKPLFLKFLAMSSEVGSLGGIRFLVPQYEDAAQGPCLAGSGRNCNLYLQGSRLSTSPQTLSKQIGVKPDADATIAPHHHWPLDHASLHQHQGRGSGVIHHGQSGGVIQLAPGRALAVHQRLPAHGGQPPWLQVGRHTPS